MLRRLENINFKQLHRQLTPYYFLSPVIVLMLAFVAYPILNVFYYSLQHYNPVTPGANGLIWFNNYIELFKNDKTFWPSLIVSAKWVFFVVSIQFILGLVCALVLNSKFKGRGFMRSITFAPWALSGVMIAIIWSLIFNQHIGVLNDFLMKIGIINEPVAWLANQSSVFGSVVVAEVWGGVPFFAIALLAQLQSVPNELYESCEIDGGNSIAKFRFITFPFLKDTIILTTLLRAVWEFSTVDLIFVLTGGGPMNMTSTLSVYLTNVAFKTSNFGYGSAIGVVTFFIMLICSLVYLKLNKLTEEN
ncbi:sugar ABC transporter permease [Paenibacillus sp. LHD-38]|uniref:carbohydrate ABC transporter permease n=1 Tax=Paenibacillus sp. LHD-38 TaxID=3072143 RepID=UPI00280E4AAF|nr:sugar ABC transporter permease [Paenibacillus sp. LHD-38]MDQ8736200.1 sugar ABC transporter permease [Paenibacillus sp. LHD-38]